MSTPTSENFPPWSSTGVEILGEHHQHTLPTVYSAFTLGAGNAFMVKCNTAIFFVMVNGQFALYRLTFDLDNIKTKFRQRTF